MAYLSDILQLMRYTSEKEHVRYVKLLAYRGAFQNPEYFFKKDLNKTHHQIVINALKIREQTSLNDKYPLHTNNIISDDEARKLLNTQFKSLEDGFNWLSNTADLFFLRDSFFDEGVGVNKEKEAINTKKWIIDNRFKEDSANLELFDCIKELHLVDSQPWPDNKNIKHVVLFSNLDSIVKKRIAFIKNFSGKLYCLTGPRGLFNFESALAPILADWFDALDKVDLIQQVLDKHQDKNDQLQWTMDLTGLKKEILNALKLKDWPEAKHSFYYKNQFEYDSAAVLAEREKLDCLNGAWPVAMDLIHFYIKKYNLTDVQLIPVVALGKNGRLTGVNDEIEAWYKQYGKNNLLAEEQPLFIACNKIHALPFILNNLMSQEDYQNSIIQHDLSKKTITYCTDEQSVLSDFQISNPLLIVGPGSANEKFNLQEALDSLAKSLFNARCSIKKAIFEYATQKNNEQFSQTIYVEKMIFYHRQGDHIRLVNAAFDLALTFYFKHQLIKTSGLLQFAYNVLLKTADKDLVLLIQQLNESALMTTHRFIKGSSNYQPVSQKSDILFLKKMTCSHKLNLAMIRKKIEDGFSKIQNYADVGSLLSCNTLCFYAMRHFITSLMEQSANLLNIKKLNYAYVFMGSYSKLQATPFSDIESFLIVEHEHVETIELAKNQIKLLLLFLINLGETVLPSLGIHVCDKRGKQASLVGTLFDTYTQQGLSFDRYVVNGGKTPLGLKKNGEVLYRLIGTPESLVNQLIVNGFHKDIVLPQLLSNTRFLCGNEALYSKFLACITKQFVNKYAYAKILLQADISRHMNSLDLSNISSIDHKKHYYIPINVLIHDLSMMLPINIETNAFEKIDQLHQYALINWSQRNILKENLALSSYLRLQQHFKYKEHKTEISKDDKLFPILTRSNKKLKSIFLFFDQKIKQTEIKRLKKENILAKEYNEPNTKLPSGSNS